MIIFLLIIALIMACAYVWMAFRDPESLWDLARLGYRLEGVEARPGPGWETREKISAVLCVLLAVIIAVQVIGMERATAQQLDRLNQTIHGFPHPTPTVYSDGNPRYGR